MNEELKERVAVRRKRYKDLCLWLASMIENEPDDAEKKRFEAIRKAIRNSYWENWSKLPSVWVARDLDNSLWIYTTKPVKSDGMFCCSAAGEMFQIDDSVYPEITFDNSPIKVKLLFIDA